MERRLDGKKRGILDLDLALERLGLPANGRTTRLLHDVIEWACRICVLLFGATRVRQTVVVKRRKA